VSRRFYVEAPALDDGRVELTGALAHRLTRVLRLHAGDEIALFDGSGREARVRLDAMSERAVRGVVMERYDGAPEPPVRVHLYQAIAKGDRFDWLLEKGTELGIARFVPLLAARSVVRTPAEGQRAERWRRVVTEAAEQCGRTVVPEVEAPQQLRDALGEAPGVKLLAYEQGGEFERNVQGALDAEIDELYALGAVSLFVGPEGGFAPEEVERAREAGVAVVTMGQRVLRSETAGVVAATLVMHAIGELG
jgi:16S rRNA (uracil1498-N3)-methyltransferase